MGLLRLNTLPNPQDQVESLQRTLAERNRQLAALDEALRQEKQKTASIERGVAELREVLNPLYTALRHIYGEIDRMGESGGSANPRVTAAWESWKEKLGGHTAKAIDVLLLHGSMNRTQLRIHLNCATGTVVNVVSALNKAGLINKNGSNISLKEL